MASEKFIKRCLKKHNEYRAQHKVKPLAISEELNQSAQKWAEHISSINSLQHSVAGKTRKAKTGENIYCMGTSDTDYKLKGSAAVKSWYSEIKDYNFSNTEDQIMNKFHKIGHFSQVVWKGTKAVGVGMCQNSKGQFFVVCQYEPAGNMVGAFKKNVLDSNVERSISSSSEEEEVAKSSSSSKNDVNRLADDLQKTKVTTFTVSEFQYDCLQEHNNLRKLHKVPELR